MWSKVLGAAVMPLNVALGAALLALLLRRRWRRLSLVVLVVGLLQLFAASLPAVARACARGLESRYPPTSPEALPAADAIVVLGGAVAPAPVAGGHPELTDGTDRVLHAARAYRATRAPLVVATGGGIEGGGDRAEADDIADLLVEWGVPRAAILLDREARTTRENATGVRAALAGRPVRRILLVTSALHMPRAVGCFEAEGFEVLAAPTDYLAPTLVRPRWTDWLPDASALEATSAAVHEVVGRWWYRLRGWCE
jgi:uncharacterized SAM-binding protein YcdF (DUF218 family)